MTERQPGRRPVDIGGLFGRVIGAVSLLCAVGIAGELLAAALTGRAARGYAYLPQDATVTLNGEVLSLEEVAHRYRPQVTMDPRYMPPTVGTIWYQGVEQNDAVPREDALTLVYYLDWDNEIHPQPILHVLYEIYRQAVYGSTHDIEFIEITVDTATGDVRKVRYETSPEGTYNRDIPVHLIAEFQQIADWNGYDYTVRDRDTGELLMSERLDLRWNAEDPVTLAVFTWNHMYTLPALDPVDVRQDVAIEAPLGYLTDAVYAQYKFARRSQGDVVTALDETPRTVLRLLFWGAGVALAFGLFRRR
jgi:hypothetical protein